jgi:hypothetical protein
MAIVETKHRAVQGTHDSFSLQHHEFTGTDIEGQREVRAAIDICLDPRARAMDQKGKCVDAFAIADLLATAFENLLHSTKNLAGGWREVM